MREGERDIDDGVVVDCGEVLERGVAGGLNRRRGAGVPVSWDGEGFVRGREKAVGDGELRGDGVGGVWLGEGVEGDFEVGHVGCDRAADSGRAEVAGCWCDGDTVMGWLEAVKTTVAK